MIRSTKNHRRDHTVDSRRRRFSTPFPWRPLRSSPTHHCSGCKLPRQLGCIYRCSPSCTETATSNERRVGSFRNRFPEAPYKYQRLGRNMRLNRWQSPKRRVPRLWGRSRPCRPATSVHSYRGRCPRFPCRLRQHRTIVGLRFHNLLPRWIAVNRR